MASVIGILFFLVLLMSLDIVDQQAPAAAIETITAEDYNKLQDEAIVLKTRLTQLQEEMQEIVADVNLISVGSEHLLNEVNDLRDSLVAIYRSIEEKQQQLKALDNDGTIKRKEYEDKIKQLQRLNQQLAKLKEQLRLARSRPPIVYIIDRTDSVNPWLLELTDQAIRVAASDGHTAVLEFTAKTFAMRKDMFLGWARSQDKLTHYFVVMKKPSGLQYEDEIEKAIKDLGFEIGTDLVPENYKLF